MSVECFRRRRFREASLRLITALRVIAAGYAADGMKVTVRQLYYQCVARGRVDNNAREYQKIIRLLTDAREMGISVLAIGPPSAKMRGSEFQSPVQRSE